MSHSSSLLNRSSHRRLILSLALTVLTVNFSLLTESQAQATSESQAQATSESQAQATPESQAPPHKSASKRHYKGTSPAEPKGPPSDISQIPLPKARGFWGTFFFWLGGVFCMYQVGKRVFSEQAHERQTLKRLRDEIGHFFPEFEPINIQKWVSIAAPHLYHGRREGDFSSMESFTSDVFLKAQLSLTEELNERGHKRVAHFDKVIAVHTLGASWAEDETQLIKHPPQGVELTLRVESKAIDFVEDQTGTLISGKKKPHQFESIWRLIHNGKTWTLVDVYDSKEDITHLSQFPPLPPIAEWRRPT